MFKKQFDPGPFNSLLEKEKKSLRGALNELKGRLLELIIYREINQARRQAKPLTHFQNRAR
jgi:hypothetical protein